MVRFDARVRTSQPLCKKIALANKLFSVNFSLQISKARQRRNVKMHVLLRPARCCGHVGTYFRFFLRCRRCARKRIAKFDSRIAIDRVAQAHRLSICQHGAICLCSHGRL